MQKCLNKSYTRHNIPGKMAKINQLVIYNTFAKKCNFIGSRKFMKTVKNIQLKIDDILVSIHVCIIKSKYL